jgi:hypothetical protein
LGFRDGILETGVSAILNADRYIDVVGPTWIECMIDKDEKVLPMIPGGGDINDIIMK